MQRISILRWFSGAGMLAMLACGGRTALAAFAEPAVFASEHGVLDILMIAKPRPIPSISFAPLGGGAVINPIGWVYEICRRPATGDVRTKNLVALMPQ
jgi:L-ascorbate oxidase